MEAKQFLEAGKRLASPAPGDEVVISGMAGHFPESNNIYELWDHLINNRDMITLDDRRWDITKPGIPHRAGKIPHLEKFDAGFFDIGYRESTAMDPQSKHLLERSVEAIFDAGYNLEQIRGTRTGVIVSNLLTDIEKHWYYDSLESGNNAITGCTRSMQAQRISRLLRLKGPSFSIDTGSSSSVYAIEHGYRAIRTGKCDNVLVCASNLCLQPKITSHYFQLGALSADGKCKCFDETADGYVRSEAIVVILLQKAKDAKRIYGQLVHIKTNVDGYKEKGQTYPSGDMQKQLMNEIYEECGVDPSTIHYLESHATGTKVGDPEEITAAGHVFCKNRTKPLPIGSLKSNLGHVEPASGMCSLIKILMCMENDIIPANLNFNQVKKGLEAIETGKMVVVTKNIPWPEKGTKLAALNNLGIGGANAHIVIRHFAKQKQNKGVPKDDLPRLICVSGRTREAVNCILDDVSKRTFDAEFIRLIQEVFEYDIDGHPYRGYGIVSKNGSISSPVEIFDGNKQPLCLFLGDYDQSGLKNLKPLFELSQFQAVFQKIHQILLPTNFNLMDVMKKELNGNFTNVVMTSFAIQIALMEILKSLHLELGYFTGHSFGEIAAAYGDGALTLDQAILTAYCIAENWPLDKDSQDIELKKKAQVIEFQKDYVNGFESPTQFEINNKDYQARNALVLQLSQIIKKPKEFSYKWLTNSKEEHIYASPNYFVNQLLNDQSKIIYNVPSNVLLLKMGSESLGKKDNGVINLSEVNMDSLLNVLGRIYNFGFNPKVAKLYPEVQWPVSVKTPMISPLIKWNYDIDWFVPRFTLTQAKKPGAQKFQLNLKSTSWAFINGHVLDGRNLVPATAYIYMAWETFALELGEPMFELNVIFKDVRFLRATNITKNSDIELTVTVQKSTGKFEVLEQNQLVACGYIGISDTKLDNSEEPVESDESTGMSSKDIYKELSLRGYNYTGEFKNVQKCNLDVTKGSIKWNGNWIAFIDNMLQLKLVQTDTRNLVVPTLINEITINAIDHLEYSKQYEENPSLPVYLNNEAGSLRCGGIELKGFTSTSISRRKNPNEPILQSFKFVPLIADLTTAESTRVTAQLLQENNNSYKLKVVEIYEDSNLEPLSPLLQDAFTDIPLIQTEIIVLSQTDKEIRDVVVKKEPFSSKFTSCSMIIAPKVLTKPKSKNLLGNILGSLNENGAILSREGRDFDPSSFEEKFLELCLLSVHKTETEQLVLFRKKRSVPQQTTIDVTDTKENFEWLPKLQEELKNRSALLLVSQNQTRSGILGFQKSLKCEPGTGNVKCVFLMDKGLKFDSKDDFYVRQLEKGLFVNVLKNGQWGTYRHILLNPPEPTQSEHIVNAVTVKGDLSSFRWLQGPLTSKSSLPPEKELVYIYSAGLNFRDIMTALGRINNDAIVKDRLKQSNIQGIEFAGKTASGKRVMGIAYGGAIASLIDAEKYSVWEIPDHLTFDDAATIPLAYATVLYSLIVTAKIKKGQSILIHAGSGAVGQAAIHVASYYKCNIFTTVGSLEKRKFLKKLFPHLKDNQIGNSRDCSFEQMIKTETYGQGVEIVLNSLAEEKQEATVRCLADGGTYLELEKFDLIRNHHLMTTIFNKGCSFNGIMLDLIHAKNPKAMQVIEEIIKDGLIKGYVKPLNKTLFGLDEVEKAYRFMAGARHMGKVIIKIREENKTQIYNGLPEFHCDPNKSYIIGGGLGGFGVELADWLVLRGAKKLVIVSRRGFQNGYQASRINNWEKHGVRVVVTTDDIISKEGCVSVINRANKFGPVDAIFNLAVVLQDFLFENQTEEMFKISLGAKAIATENFDEISRKMCPELKYFVAFSSMSSGLGNAGQTNYAMGNSRCERICEERHRDGYPAVAIQWGSIGDVGMVAEAQTTEIKSEVAGTMQQPIVSCLNVLNVLLKQNEPVVSSMVVAEKKNKAAASNSLVDAVRVIMGFKNLKGISMHTPFPQLGMDSIMAVEIRQTLEREYDVFLTAPEIRNMTYASLQQIMDSGAVASDNKKSKEVKYQNLDILHDVYLLLPVMVKDKNSDIPLLEMKSNLEGELRGPKAFFLPGIDGQATRFEPLAQKLNYNTFCLQLPYGGALESSIEDISQSLLPRLQENLDKTKPFSIVAYSFGCVVAVHIVHILETQGYSGNLILIDGAPSMFTDLIRSYLPEGATKDKMETILLAAIMKLYVPLETVLTNLDTIDGCTTLEERINFVANNIPEDENHSLEDRKKMCSSLYARLHALATYSPTFDKLKSTVKLIKPTQPIHPTFDHDYKVGELCENNVEVITCDGTHLDVTKNPEIIRCINSLLTN